MNVIDASDLHKSYGTRVILGGVGFTIDEADKVGIVGRNGCGKSTLFRILAQQEEPDTGRVARRRGLSVGFLPQRPQMDAAATIRQILEQHLGDSRRQLLRHQTLATALPTAEGTELQRLLGEQQQVQAWLDHHSAWNLDHRVEEMCSRFNIPDPDVRVGTLSGGWAQRVALAGILLSQPDLLLLDEPTNQLDAETIEWLETHLQGYPGAILLVTHDRYFLDRVVDRMFELEDGTVTAYRGGYSQYLEQKAERLALQEREQTRLLNLLRREEAWLARGAKARSTKQKARIGRVEDMRERKVTARTRDLCLDITPSRALGGTVLESRALTVEIDGQCVVRNLDFILRKGERVGILGPNGCGKTTLIRTLLGERAPQSGAVSIGKHTHIGYLDQLRSGLDDTQTVSESLGEDDWVMVGGPRGRRRHKTGYLEDFLFPRQEQKKPVSTLSGGERARLLLAKLMLTGANVLVLDEPTNDLDIPTLQVLDEALADFEGCVLMVTHDRYFLDRVATAILHFEGEGRVIHYEGNYEIFTRLRQRAEGEDKRQAAAVAAAASTKECTAKTQPKRSGLSYRERQELETVEREIEALEGQRTELEASLANPAALAGDHRGLQQLGEEFAALGDRLDALLQRWEELEAKR